MDKYRFSDTEQALMEGLEIPFAIYQFINRRVVTIALSKGFCDLFGYDDIATAYYDMDNDMYKDTHQDDISRIADAAYHFATEGGSYNVIYRSKDREGTGYNIIHAHGKHVYTEDGIRLAQVWYTDEGSYTEGENLSDTMIVHSLKNALHEDSFLKASYYDHLTGLPGMTYFFELATAHRQAICDEGGTPALLFTDFSGMKYYNHKYGFAEGDKLLLAFGRLLADFFGSECCSRIGQDYFTIITKSEGLEERLTELFEKCAKLNEGRSLPLHIGIFQHWYDGIVASMACDRAKFACDMLRNEYSSEFSYYNMSMKDVEEKQQYIIANLDKAIAERWIKVYYQPIIRAVNGRVCDEEALARWIDPVKGFMSPADFIPVLEDHNLIYKLDLYVVECVLQKIKTLKGAGLHIMPQSVNLSRSDFDCCDIVEEIRKRVDDFGISRSLLTIEITESMIAKDFDYLKSQIDRFKEYGFSVWMDDFGSGYSSLDVLQSMKIDLIKFDMRFMQQFDKSEKSKIILTELLRMATSLGIDTVCEGVETEEQVRFLSETGCSKLQGYYFEKPIPVEKILEKYAQGRQIGFEEPTESEYYEDIGRVNLHDLSVIAKGDRNKLEGFFNTLPMAIIEVKGDYMRFTRTNQSYRKFFERFFKIPIDQNLHVHNYHDRDAANSSTFERGLLQSCNDPNIVFIDEVFPGNTIVHSCMRRIAVNPNTGTVATVLAVLSVSDGDKGASYANIARALAADYFSLYYVNVDTEDFIEYTSDSGNESLTVERRGKNFFSESRKDALTFLYMKDRDDFVAAFTKENVLRSLNERGSFTFTYQLLMNEKPVYVSMKAMRMHQDPSHIIIGVSNIDAQIKQKKMLEKLRVNEISYSRFMALTGDFICIYTVDIDTESYREYGADSTVKKLGISKHGTDFFESSLRNSRKIVSKEEYDRLSGLFTKENVLSEIEQNGAFKMSYHLVIEGKNIPVFLKAVLIKEEDGDKLMVGLFRADNNGV